MARLPEDRAGGGVACVDTPRLGRKVAADILHLGFDPPAKLGQRLLGRGGGAAQRSRRRTGWLARGYPRRHQVLLHRGGAADRTGEVPGNGEPVEILAGGEPAVEAVAGAAAKRKANQA